MQSDPDKSNPESAPIGLGADLTLTAWILVVAFTYYAPIVNPQLGRAATVLAPVYALMVLLSVLSVALRRSRSRQARTGEGSPSTIGADMLDDHRIT